MEKLIYLSPLFLTGCVAAEWIVGNEGAIKQASESIEGFGPYGALIGLGITSVVSAAKWYEHKIAAKEVISAIQKSKSKLPTASKTILKDALYFNMPNRVEKYVAKIKKNLK